MQLPTLDQGFATQFQSPTGYPAPLLVGSTATLGIVPSPPTAGTVEGTLTWDVDAPNAPFVVQTLLEFIEAGTAVSPGKLVFGAIAVDATTPRQSVTLENCNVDPIHVTLSGIAPTKGELEAWDLLPATGERTLAPHDTMTLTVAFTPKKPGSHVANIVLDVDGEQHLVELDGDGIGSTLDKTSFYACNCSGSGTPAHGWPIVVALAFVVRRRRRRASVPSPSGSS
jgi:MYXO-CTERM domain-containing protein